MLGHTLLVASLVAAAEPTSVNALWNDDEGFGIWLYGRPGSCHEFAYAHPPFVVVGNGGKASAFREARLDAAALKVCMRATPPAVAFCTRGHLDVRYDPTNNEYVGSYHLSLSDGSVWSGPFRAQYCKSK